MTDALEVRRREVLRALGITRWVSRTALVRASAAASADTAEARADAFDAQSWEMLRDEVRTCRACGIRAQCTQTVFGTGPTNAHWMVVGEAPGAGEDKQGEPFVGRAGQLLTQMLRAIGLPRERVFVANVLKCRPPQNRDPLPAEVANCLPYLKRQIAAIRPVLILAVGRIAAQNLLSTTDSLARLRGNVHAFGPLKTPLVVTYHPSYLLRSPADKSRAWIDLKFARHVFGTRAAASSVSATRS